MRFFKRIHILSAIIITVIFSLFVYADIHDETIAKSVSVIKSLEDNFKKPVLTRNPIGLDIESGFVKKFSILFNTALYEMDQIEQLPMSFENKEYEEIPVLLYHHVTMEEGYGDNVISVSTLNKHLIAIKNAGYSTVSVKQLINYVYYGEDLPDKPILITFDDGYLSNYELAYPLLKKHGMKATIFAIGWAIGKDEYKDTGISIIPHFGYKHIKQMTESGLIEVQSHTFDMHQSKDLEQENLVRETVLKHDTESEQEYIAALENDYISFDKLLFNCTGNRNYAIAYPHGDYTELSEEILKKLGAKVSFVTEYKNKNIIVKGDANSLRVLNRFTVSESISASQLISLIDSVYSDKRENSDE